MRGDSSQFERTGIVQSRDDSGCYTETKQQVFSCPNLPTLQSPVYPQLEATSHSDPSKKEVKKKKQPEDNSLDKHLKI